MRTVLKKHLWVMWSILFWGKGVFSQELSPQQWGALFFSKEMRIAPTAVIVDKKTKLIYQGLLQGRGKKPVYWINTQMRETLPKGVKSKGEMLIIRDNQYVTELKPGETYDIAENKASNNKDDEISEQ